MPASDLPLGLKKGLERSLGSLKMLPAVARDALRLAHSPHCDFQKLTTILNRDIRLAAFVLKTANSTLFSPPAPIASLNRAVSFLGQRRIGDLIVASSLDGLHAHVPARQEQPRALLWLHSFLTAILATQLNQLWNLRLDGEEFAAGLLHDFGRTLILIAEPDRASRIDPLDFVEAPGLEERERLVLEISHAELGAWFAEANQLPQPLVTAVRFHHRPAETTEHQRLTALVAAADHAANWLQQQPRPELYQARSNTAVDLLESLGVSGARERFNEAIAGLQAKAPTIAEKMIAV